jgi:hypothetical protein
MADFNSNDIVRSINKRYFRKNKTVKDICRLSLSRKFGFLLRISGFYFAIEGLLNGNLFYMFLYTMVNGINGFYTRFIDSNIFLTFLLDFGDNNTCIAVLFDIFNNLINMILAITYFSIFSIFICFCFCFRNRDTIKKLPIDKSTSTTTAVKSSSDKKLTKTASNDSDLEESKAISFNDFKKSIEQLKNDEFHYFKVLDKEDQENFYNKMVELECDLTSGTIKIDHWFTIMHNLENEGLLKNEYDLFRFSYYGEQAGRSIVHEKFTNQKVNFMSFNADENHVNNNNEKIKEIKIMFEKQTQNWHIDKLENLKNLKSTVNKNFVFEGLLD